MPHGRAIGATEILIFFFPQGEGILFFPEGEEKDKKRKQKQKQKQNKNKNKIMIRNLSLLHRRLSGVQSIPFPSSSPPLLNTPPPKQQHQPLLHPSSLLSPPPLSRHFSSTTEERGWREEGERPKTDTIFAASTAAGKAALSVFRITGPQSGEILQKLTKSRLPTPRMAALKTLTHPGSGHPVDRALVLWFPGPNSFSGEDLVELHVHGGVAVRKGVADAVLSLRGNGLDVRPALAGEFTKRAFYNNKLDYTQVEGLADVIHADTSMQLQQALRQLSGHVGNQYEEWRTLIVKCLANVESVIDFGEEEDHVDEEHVLGECDKKVSQLLEQIEKALLDVRGEKIREGLRIALVGPPNAGKSSLMNVLAARDVSIVSEFEGTTRDVIEVEMDIGGYSVVLQDTAGVRETENPIEQEGVRRARRHAKEADVRVIVVDISEFQKQQQKQKQQHQELLQKIHHIFEEETSPSSSSPSPSSSGKNIILLNKCDLMASKFSLPENLPGPGLLFSCQDSTGVDQFLNLLQEHIHQIVEENAAEESPLITRTRHRHYLEECREHLKEYLNLSSSFSQVEFAAEELRLAGGCLGQVTGKIGVEEVLGVLFKEFCIGK